MEAPPVQYVRADDGFDIAYTVCGDGMPFVFVPWPFSHRGLWWGTAFGRPLSEALAQRFRLIQYDSRGQGMSTRGLPEDHVIEDYLRDLEAVIDHVVPDRFVLYGGPIFWHVAVRYALKYPERVAALVLGDVAWSSFGGPSDKEESVYFEGLARGDWDLFLHTFVRAFSLKGAPFELPYWRESIDQRDWLRQTESGRRAESTTLLPEITVPTLILNNRRLADDEPVYSLAEYGQAAASMIPNARLVLFDGWASVWYSDGPEPPEAVRLIESFLDGLGLMAHRGRDLPAEPATRPHSQLTPREQEIIRLIVRGLSNQQIADELVLSVRTVERHITNLYAKISARSKADATAYALRNGLA